MTSGWVISTPVHWSCTQTPSAVSEGHTTAVGYSLEAREAVLLSPYVTH